MSVVDIILLCALSSLTVLSNYPSSFFTTAHRFTWVENNLVVAGELTYLRGHKVEVVKLNHILSLLSQLRICLIMMIERI